MPEVGELAPDFTLVDAQETPITLSSLRGSWVVLYFYPKDNTPGCTTEACDFSNSLERFTGLDARVLGVSPDPIKSHRKFIEDQGLQISLLSDPDHRVAEGYGAWAKKRNYGKEYLGIERSTFLIDPEGRIAHAWRKVKVEGHVRQVRDKLQELQEQRTSR